ncbi:MAG: sigma-70 family RNA polymerase sigma factor, partial [Maioricimonas sp. JB045]
SERDWQAFYEFVVNGRPSKDIAAELDMSVNSVYLAKSRILSVLRSEFAGLIEGFDSENSG